MPDGGQTSNSVPSEFKHPASRFEGSIRYIETLLETMLSLGQFLYLDSSDTWNDDADIFSYRSYAGYFEIRTSLSKFSDYWPICLNPNWKGISTLDHFRIIRRVSCGSDFTS